MSADPHPRPENTDIAKTIRPLGTLKPGARAKIIEVLNHSNGDDLERQLLEVGFIEGALIELLHQGPFGDPIAVRIDHRLTVALRRREANAILVTPSALE